MGYDDAYEEVQTEKESRQRYCSTSIASSKPTRDSLAGSSNGGSSDCESCGGKRRNPASDGLSRCEPHISAFNTARGSFGTSSTTSASSSDDTSKSVITIPIDKRRIRAYIRSASAFTFYQRYQRQHEYEKKNTYDLSQVHTTMKCAF